MAIASIDLNVIAIAITFAATTYHPDNQSKALTLMPEAAAHYSCKSKHSCSQKDEPQWLRNLGSVYEVLRLSICVYGITDSKQAAKCKIGINLLICHDFLLGAPSIRHRLGKIFPETCHGKVKDLQRYPRALQMQPREDL